MAFVLARLLPVLRRQREIAGDKHHHIALKKEIVLR